MTGYLDTAFSQQFGVGTASASLRQLLSQIAGIGSASIRVFGFGNRVVSVAVTSNQDVMVRLVRQDFYTDNDTRLEDVLDSLARDTAHTSTHIIITDGRRGGGAASLAQYKRIGESVRRWTANTGGLFALLALDAPFTRVRGDHAGCWDESDHKVLRCPLYAFVFTPVAGSTDLLDALRGMKGRLFVVPTLADSNTRVTAQHTPGVSSGDLHIFAATPSAPLTVLYQADASRPQAISSTHVVVHLSLAGGVARYSSDDSMNVTVEATPLLQVTGPQWSTPDKASTWLRHAPTLLASPSDLQLDFELRARFQMPPTAYRVNVSSAGRPSWIQEFDAPQYGDLTRTYGLASLFEYLKPKPTLLGTFFVGLY